MKALARRSVLAGIAAAPVVTVPAIASESDAGLFDLHRQLKQSHRRYMDAIKAFNDADEMRANNSPKLPPGPEPPAEYAEMYKKITVGELALLGDVMSSHPLVVWRRSADEGRAPLLDAHSAECAAVREKCGYDEAQNHLYDCQDEFFEHGKKVFATRAHTLAGIVAKIDAAKLVYPDGEGEIVDAWDSVAADIRALAVQS